MFIYMYISYLICMLNCDLKLFRPRTLSSKRFIFLLYSVIIMNKYIGLNGFSFSKSALQYNACFVRRDWMIALQIQSV